MRYPNSRTRSYLDVLVQLRLTLGNGEKPLSLDHAWIDIKAALAEIEEALPPMWRKGGE